MNIKIEITSLIIQINNSYFRERFYNFCRNRLFWGPLIIFIFIIGFSGLIYVYSYSVTYVTGPISTDTTWTLVDSPYVIQGRVTILEGVTLTIEPGVIVKFYSSSSNLEVFGILNSQGTESQPVYFTSFKDDIGGDSNGDGSATSPAPEDWGNIYFSHGSNSTLTNTVVRYGGTSVRHEGTVYSGALILNDATLTINGSQSKLTDNFPFNIHVIEGNLTVSDVEIANSQFGVYVYPSGNVSISNSSIHDHEVYGVYNLASVTVDAKNNWWGDPSGPYHPSLNPDGQGDRVSDRVDFIPWLGYDPTKGPVCGNNKCESGEAFENCYQDCIEQGIEKYFPYWTFSKNEEYFPASFYFDSDANTENNQENYDAWTNGLPPRYVYIHTVEDPNYFTIQYWLYEAFNRHKICCNHEHDWDGTIFVVFDKSDFSQPAEIRFARHFTIDVSSWAEVEKIDNTHIVAYVAKGSHGAYPSAIDADSLNGDEFEEGGRQFGPDDFNWYYTIKEKDCFEKRSLPVQGEENREFCNLEPVLLRGSSQPYPREWEAGHEGYWPYKFLGEKAFFIPSIKAPWRDSKWAETRPEGLLDWLEFLLGSSADLHIYDPLGRHIGINYETGEPEIQIPDAIYTIEADGQHILIPNPIDGDYRVKIVGKEDSVYNLITVRNKDEQFIYWKENKDIPISKDEIHTFIQNPSSRMIPKILKEDSITKLEKLKKDGGEVGAQTLNKFRTQRSLIAEAYASVELGGGSKKIDDPKEALFINIFKITLAIISIVIYGLILWAIFKLIALIKREKLEPINKKILLISAGISVAGGILMFLFFFLMVSSDFDFETLLPYFLTDEILRVPFLMSPAFFLSLSLLLFSFILYKKYLSVWQNIRIRLFYLILMMIIYGNIPVLGMFLKAWLTPGRHYSLLKLPLEPFLWFVVLSLIGAVVGFVFFVFFVVPTAFIITKGIKRIGWRIALIVILTILMCFSSGFLVGATAYFR